MADEAVRITFDQSNMTFREMKIFEDIAGIPVGAWNTISVPTSEMLVAAAYISMRRDDPTLTVDDVWEMNIQKFDFNENPTAAEPTPLKPLERPAKTSTRRAKAS